MMRLLMGVLLLSISSCTTTRQLQEEEFESIEEPTCPKVQIIAVNGATWGNKMDKMNLDTATNRCAQLYKNSPCLVSFMKLEDNRYHAVCGAKR